MPKISVTKTTAKKSPVKAAPKAKTSSKIKEEKKPVEKESTAKVLKSDELLG